MNLDCLKLSNMHSGNFCLNLTERVNWDKFPLFANAFVEENEAKIVNKSQAADMAIWEIEINQCVLRLVYDDYPQMVSLESKDDLGNVVLEELAAKFSIGNHRHPIK